MNQKGFAKIDFLSIEMPFTTIPNEHNLGFTGIHYNLLLDKTFYTGIGIYGAVPRNNELSSNDTSREL